VPRVAVLVPHRRTARRRRCAARRLADPCHRCVARRRSPPVVTVVVLPHPAIRHRVVKIQVTGEAKPPPL
jgi:hypothetical protein